MNLVNSAWKANGETRIQKAKRDFTSTASRYFRLFSSDELRYRL